MATCQNCGSDLNGPYCNPCGARAPEDRAQKKVSKPAAHKPSTGRSYGLFSPQRIGRTTAMGLLGLMLFGAGTVTGYWLGTSSGGPLTSTSVDATADSAMPAIALASQYMDEGVSYLNDSNRTAAGSSFRQAISQSEKGPKEEP